VTYLMVPALDSRWRDTLNDRVVTVVGYQRGVVTNSGRPVLMVVYQCGSDSGAVNASVWADRFEDPIREELRVQKARFAAQRQQAREMLERVKWA